MRQGLEKYFLEDPFQQVWPGGQYSFQMDDNGIVLISYPKSNYMAPGIGLQYHPTVISVYALSQFNRFLSTGDAQCRDTFLKYSDWLVANLLERDGLPAWNLNFNWRSPGYRCHAPWICSMTYGIAISALLRAWQVTRREEYLTTCKRALAAFEVPVSSGGLLRTYGRDDTWYEGIPSPIGAQILNEVLFALIGLFEMHKHAGNDRAKRLFDRGIATVRIHLKEFDLNLVFFRWSRYDNKWLLYSGDKYHGVQTEQLKWLARVTGDDLFADYGTKWEAWQKKYSARGRLTGKHIFLPWYYVYSVLLKLYATHLQR